MPIIYSALEYPSTFLATKLKFGSDNSTLVALCARNDPPVEQADKKTSIVKRARLQMIA